LGPLKGASFNHRKTQEMRVCADLDQILWMGGNKNIYNKNGGNNYEP
jgi:hypothetical protein